MDAQHTKHVTYKLAYHCVWCRAYRKKILVGKLATFKVATALIGWHSMAHLISWASRLRYMSGPIIEESSEERKERERRIITLPEEACPTGIAL
jgi:hypothetical protein